MPDLYIARSGLLQLFSIMSRHVVSQLPKTLSIANFRAYHVRLIYRVQESLEVSFFRVIVIIRFRLTRNVIISVRSVNLIVIVIDGTAQRRRYARIQQEYESLPSLGGVE
ncbi:hypothetical protein M9H77_21463 [Catharanthus roseus]|uniref:Uncharacterized protein n=1 Tax=Catharanthus roseus TaxID=4058 RepID=A0ACC0AMN5_CATRO|nr:hypothetical protein M9H77_21463 [Catharanthus roseus]